MSLGSFKKRINNWDRISSLNDNWVHCECQFCKKDFKKLRNDRVKICRYCRGQYNAHKTHDVFKTLKRRVFGKQKECQICFKKNKNLILHHKDGNPENNNVKNLIICCRQCHARIHKGIKGNVGESYIREYFSHSPIKKSLKSSGNSFYKAKNKEIKYSVTIETRTSVAERTAKLIRNKGKLKNQNNNKVDTIRY